MLLRQEIPYGTEVVIEEFKEAHPEDPITRIHATVHVERKSHKSILIGKKGSMMKRIGTLARKDIETFLGNKVYLELYVKVSEGWKDKDGFLNNFGYQ